MGTLGGGRFTQGNDSTFNSFTGNLTMTGGTFTINQKRALVAASSGTTTWDISGGTFAYTHSDGTKNGTFRFGTAWKNNTPTWTGDYTATLNLSNNASFSADRFILGFSNYGVADKTLTANMNMSDTASVTLGASAGNEHSNIGYGVGVTASLTMEGKSTLTAAGTLYIGGDGSTGSLAMSGNSQATLEDQLYVGNSTTSKGTITLIDSAKLTVSSSVGVGNGELSFGNTGECATYAEMNTLNLGSVAGANSTMNVAGGTVTGTDMHIGNAGTGTVTVSAGTVTFSNHLYTGHYSTGTLNIEGGNVSGTDFSIGHYAGANGTMSLTGGAVTGRDMYIGNAGTGTATISAGTVRFTNNLYTGRTGTGTLNIEGGDVQGAYFCIGHTDGASGTVNVTGGTLDVTINLRVGLGGKGTMTVSGGATSVTTVNLFLPDNGSSLKFVMDDNRFTPITVSGTTTLDGTLTADFGGGLQFAKNESLTLIENASGDAGGLTDSDYFTVSQDGNNIFAKVRTDLLPDDRSNRGVAEISADNNGFTFYTGLWEDPDLLDMFVTWLNDANKNLNAQAVELGGVLVQVPTNSFYALWDFSEFNTATGANVVFSQTPIVPEPASWMLLLLGLCALRRKLAKTRTVSVGL
ncbi:MAG: hypothetical protein Q4D98_10145 [Planctomycetia bacterium]|nr:hypothetical protein [Planctomycetia bacterium]